MQVSEKDEGLVMKIAADNKAKLDANDFQNYFLRKESIGVTDGTAVLSLGIVPFPTGLEAEDGPGWAEGVKFMCYPIGPSVNIPALIKEACAEAQMRGADRMHLQFIDDDTAAEVEKVLLSERKNGLVDFIMPITEAQKL